MMPHPLENGHLGCAGCACDKIRLQREALSQGGLDRGHVDKVRCNEEY